MGRSPGDSSFKFLFWGLVVIAAVLFAAQPFFLLMRSGHWTLPRISFIHPLAFNLAMPMILIALYTLVVGSFVHRDAGRRGMDAWLWTTIAVFVPAFVGLVIYLVVRGDRGRLCLNCERPLQTDFRVCPYCGHSRDLRCGECQTPVASDWKVCPRCGHPLGEPSAGRSLPASLNVK